MGNKNTGEYTDGYVNLPISYPIRLRTIGSLSRAWARDTFRILIPSNSQIQFLYYVGDGTHQIAFDWLTIGY